MLRAAFLACLALLAAPSVAGAYVVQERGGLLSGTNGIALGPDGNLWIAEYGSSSVARITPGGQLVQRYVVGANPTSLAVGPGGRVWVSVTGADKLVWFDALAAVPSEHPVDTSGVSPCGPVAIVAADNGRMYFSLPNDGLTCAAATPSRIGYVNDDGTGLFTAAGFGTAFDLEYTAGKLFVPDFNGTTVRRLSPALTAEAQVTVAGSLLDGIAADANGSLWVTRFTTGNNLVRFPAAFNDGDLATPFATGLVNPFGIVHGADGRMYVAADGSAEIARVDTGTAAVTRYSVPGAQPFQIINGPDGDIWFTDRVNPRVWRFVNSPPRATTGAARALATTAGSVDAKVDARGNETQVVFDYGTTTAYGATTAPLTVAQGVGDSDVRADLPELKPGTTYHVRVRATNAEGSVTGADTTFTTPTPPPTPVRATVAFRWGFGTAYTVLTRVLVRDVTRKDTVKLTCRGGGCGIRSRKVTGKRGTVKLTKHFGAKRRLRPGARVRIRVTAPNRIGTVVTLRVRAGKEPKVQRRCVLPGSTTLRKRC